MLTSWERQLTAPARVTDIAGSFAAEVTAIDDPSQYWKDKAFELDDLGITIGCSWLPTWLDAG